LISRDFYSHPLDWSVTDQIALVLDDHLHFTSLDDTSFKRSQTPVGDTFSLKFMDAGQLIVLGSILGPIRVVDITRDELLSSHQVNRTRACCVDCHGPTILSAHDDGSVSLCDARAAHGIRSFKVHSQLCCSVHFDYDGARFASGGEDTTCRIWDLRSSDSPSAVLEGHTAAVRAIAWSPRDRNRIATGGGTSDRHIRLWDIARGTSVVDANCGSQVCNLLWCADHSELVSTEGFQDCTVTIWNEAEMKVAARIRGHRDRVLFCAMAPREYRIATLTQQDGLKIWNLAATAEKPTAPVR
jgi:cell division cycle 20-like protein 1 (cofactor of APC complex)